MSDNVTKLPFRVKVKTVTLEEMDLNLRLIRGEDEDSPPWWVITCKQDDGLWLSGPKKDLKKLLKQVPDALALLNKARGL